MFRINNKKNLLSLLLLLLSAGSWAEMTFDPSRPPGDFVNLGLHRLYIDCRGHQPPTVIIDAGLGDSSANWMPVVEALDNEARVCVYDRAGYGWSDPGPGFRTTAQITYELHALLELAMIPPPYILVGHSFGGFTAQYFARQYPQETVGVVLIESSHPDQVEKLARLDDARFKRELVVTRNQPAPQELTPMQQKWYQLNSSRKAVFAQMDELKNFAESARQIKTAGPFPEIPLAVLSRGKTQLPNLDGISLEAVWTDMQKQLTTLSPKSWHTIIKESGHQVYADAPEVIIETIMQVLIKARLEMRNASQLTFTDTDTGGKDNRN